LTVLPCFNGSGDNIQQVSLLLSAGLDHREHRFHEATASRTLSSEREFSPDHGVSQDLFCAIVSRADSSMIQKSPQLLPALTEIATQCARRPPKML
jgi:hypothetical protein